VQFGDALICIGGTGVEHLAEPYSARRKPVIPLDLAIGASREDGTGGALRLNREALANSNERLVFTNIASLPSDRQRKL
jgi:hypothetical protein